MYKREHHRQLGLTDFNQPLGVKLNSENRWVKKAETIPWTQIEEKYAAFFPSKTGMPAKPLRMALGSLLIQKQYGYSDRELLEQITENPYYQYFIGLPGFQEKAPFAPSLLVEFRKRLTDEVLIEINELIIDFNDPDNQDKNGPICGCLLHNKNAESCKVKMEKVASPFWRKLQTVFSGSLERR